MNFPLGISSISPSLDSSGQLFFAFHIANNNVIIATN